LKYYKQLTESNDLDFGYLKITPLRQVIENKMNHFEL